MKKRKKFSLKELVEVFSSWLYDWDNAEYDDVEEFAFPVELTEKEQDAFILGAKFVCETAITYFKGE